MITPYHKSHYLFISNNLRMILTWDLVFFTQKIKQLNYLLLMLKHTLYGIHVTHQLT